MKVKSESEVAQLYLTLSDPMDYSLPGSSTHGLFQARVLEWVAIAFSGFSLPALKATGFLNAGLPSVCGILMVSQELHGQGSQNIQADSCVF